MQFKPRQNKRISLDVTPLIDVVFLLLIFFMITTTFIAHSNIKINLPESSTKSKKLPQKTNQVSITKKNIFYLNQKKIKKRMLENALIKLAKKAENKTLIIRADGKVEHQQVVFLMDIARRAGFQKLSIATLQKQK